MEILDNHQEVKLIGVARRAIDDQEKRFVQRQGYFSFTSSEVDWVYVPLPNNLHYEVAKYYLEQGINVLIEKPAATSLEQAQSLVSIANKKNAHLVEAFQWRYHERMKWLDANIASINPYLIDVVFTIPHLREDDIRYQKPLMGGAVYDLGAYPCSVLAHLFSEEDFQLAESKIWNNHDGVNMGGCGVFESNNRRLNFYYSFGKAYESRLTMHSLLGRYDIDQPFTAPPNKEVVITRLFNTVKTEYSFVDCHFSGLLKSLFKYEKRSPTHHCQISLQAKYLCQLIEGEK
ncbi:Gfo/Idh/MocA family oxidoreductase [bacterium]|nr:Gfo/Idh/MocA family oxidoreductase [bacterium]MDB4607450.1 Gfo/Idh/MocA family oxidoreductase [bacterium]